MSNDQIIELLAKGYTVKEVANMLNMKTKTVEKRITTMKRKASARTVTQLVVNWLNLGLTMQPNV